MNSILHNTYLSADRRSQHAVVKQNIHPSKENLAT